VDVALLYSRLQVGFCKAGMSNSSEPNILKRLLCGPKVTIAHKSLTVKNCLKKFLFEFDYSLSEDKTV